MAVEEQKFSTTDVQVDKIEELGMITKNEDGKIITGEGGFQTDESRLPKGYYYSASFIGSVCAIGFGFWAAVSAFAYVAPALATINADIGPDPNITWVALIHTVALSFGLTIVGRLGDIFGRRWFFIGGSMFAAAGTLVSALAVNVPMLIVGSTMKGLAAATQMSVFYSISELVPMKYRYMAVGLVYFFNIPGTCLAPLISQAFITHTKIGWRGFFYVITGANFLSGTCYFFFYHPPNFEDKHGRKDSRLTWVKNFDYVGAFLYASGLVLFLFGLSWGGTVYPWKSSAVISAIVIGVLSIIGFCLWEIYAAPAEPLIKFSLFRNRPWMTSAVLSGIGSGVYYATAIVWPVAAQVLFANGNKMYGAALSTIPGAVGTLGQMTGGCLAAYIGKQKYQAIVVATAAGAILASVSTIEPSKKTQTCVLLAVSTFLKGWLDSVSITNTVIVVDDQRNLGAAGGMSGAIRTSIASVAQVVYSSVLNTRLATTVPATVGPAVISAGLPASSVKKYLAALKSGTAASYAAVPGLTNAIRVAGTAANKDAYAQAFKTVFLASISFSLLAIITAIFSPNLDDKMTGQISSTLATARNAHNGGKLDLETEKA